MRVWTAILLSMAIAAAGTSAQDTTRLRRLDVSNEEPVEETADLEPWHDYPHDADRDGSDSDDLVDEGSGVEPPHHHDNGSHWDCHDDAGFYDGLDDSFDSEDDGSVSGGWPKPPRQPRFRHGSDSDDSSFDGPHDRPPHHFDCHRPRPDHPPPHEDDSQSDSRDDSGSEDSRSNSADLD